MNDQEQREQLAKELDKACRTNQRSYPYLRTHFGFIDDFILAREKGLREELETIRKFILKEHEFTCLQHNDYERVHSGCPVCNTKKINTLTQQLATARDALRIISNHSLHISAIDPVSDYETEFGMITQYAKDILGGDVMQIPVDTRGNQSSPESAIGISKGTTPPQAKPTAGKEVDKRASIDDLTLEHAKKAFPASHQPTPPTDAVKMPEGK